MATNEQALDHDSPIEMVLDEASIMSSLARLQEMHISVRLGLALTIMFSKRY